MSTIESLRQYLPLCWFKHNPLELTKSMGFFKQNLLFYFIVEYFMQANMTDDPFESFTEVTIETLLTFLFIGFILSLNKTFYAFIQVTTAILVCANIVSLFVIPVLIWLTINLIRKILQLGEANMPNEAQWWQQRRVDATEASRDGSAG
jgi:hypothetical protein